MDLGRRVRSHGTQAEDYLKSVEPSVWVFYATALASLAFEGSLVEFFGPGEFAVIYLLIGAGFGAYHLRATKTEQKPLGPILGLCKNVIDRSFVGGYLLTMVVGGAPGVAIILTKLHHPRRVSLTVLAVVGFVVVWSFLWYQLFAAVGIADAFRYDLVDLFS